MSLSSLRKAGLNLGPRAFAVLGPVNYLRYVATLVVCLPDVLRTRTFRKVDRAMGSRPLRLRAGPRRFTIDCPGTDAIIQDGTYTFGIIRELLIRNCYVRGRVAQAADSAATVVDLGANRGVFSVMMAASAERVVAVEALSEYAEAVECNIRANGFTNCAVEVSFVGEGGIFDDRKEATIAMAGLMDKHGLGTIDLLKLDIEGSEYALFKEKGWLERVSALCMEVHPEWGRVQDILDELERHGFDFDVTDHTFRPAADPQRAEFIYAKKKSKVENRKSKGLKPAPTDS